MSEPNAQQVLDAAPAEKWESEDEFEARLKRIESKVPTAAAGKADDGAKTEAIDKDHPLLVAENEKLKQLAEEARRRVTQLEEEVRKSAKRENEYETMLEE
jgi:hypothetical protein